MCSDKPFLKAQINYRPSRWNCSTPRPSPWNCINSKPTIETNRLSLNNFQLSNIKETLDEVPADLGQGSGHKGGNRVQDLLHDCIKELHSNFSQVLSRIEQLELKLNPAIQENKKLCEVIFQQEESSRQQWDLIRKQSELLKEQGDLVSNQFDRIRKIEESLLHCWTRISKFEETLSTHGDRILKCEDKKCVGQVKIEQPVWNFEKLDLRLWFIENEIMTLKELTPKLVDQRVPKGNSRLCNFLKIDSPGMLRPTTAGSSRIEPCRGTLNRGDIRNNFRRGGAGGKGTWGALGSELVEEEEEAIGAIDNKDPNYDDETLDNKDVKLKSVEVDRKAEDFLKLITTMVLEYFDHGDTDEVLMSLEELRINKNRHMIISSVVEIAMDHKPSHREMTSVLLADLYSNYFTEEDYAKAYDHLLNNLTDLILDTPDAPTITGNFIARSVADDCIPPKFLIGYKGKLACEHAILALARAEGLLSMRHGLVRLDNVWGVGGGTRPVKHLIKKMVLLLQEYLSSSDINEATKCLLELEVPHFHHELVYEAVNLVLEKLNERTSKMICDLLTSLCRAVIITPNQMSEGFFRIYEDMPQIVLDVPAAYTILEKFVRRCYEEKILLTEVVRKLPTRGRKRFVSEGDGGRVKDHAYF